MYLAKMDKGEPIEEFITKSRRQTFLSSWLMLTSLSGFIFLVQIEDASSKSAALGTYMTACMTLTIGSLTMIMSPRIKEKYPSCSSFSLNGAITIFFGTLLLWMASFLWISTQCHNFFCGTVHLGFDSLQSGVALVIGIDAISPILSARRNRIIIYSSVLFVSWLLVICFFHSQPIREWPVPIKWLHAEIAVIVISSGLFCFAVGIGECAKNMYFNRFISICLGVSSSAAVISGYRIMNQIEELSFFGLLYLVSHLMLSWSLALCVTMDAKYLGVESQQKYSNITEETDGMDLQELCPLRMRRRVHYGIRQAERGRVMDWKSPISATDTDVDLQYDFDV